MGRGGGQIGGYRETVILLGRIIKVMEYVVD